jgi:hypothetical protein
MLNQVPDYTPQATHLANLPVTKVSPPKTAFPNSNKGDEQKFNRICEELRAVKGLQMVDKKAFEWNKKDPLHFWQSLAFVLRSEDHVCIAVSSFVDKNNQNMLYIASNNEMNESQKQEISDIINMFLELKSEEDIAEKLLPRQLPYITKQYKKINRAQIESFEAEVPSELKELAKKVNELNVKAILDSRASLDEDFKQLLNLIWINKKGVVEMRDSYSASNQSKKLAYHLCKMIRFYEEILFVHKKIKRHQEDPAFKSLSKAFQFVHDDCHAELAILKTAKDCCTSKTLYIGVSKRPCYCCSLFIKAVEANSKVPFKISIVTTHGKLYGWKKMSNEDYFDREFEQVWAKVIEGCNSKDKRAQQRTDDNSSESGSSMEGDSPKKGFLKEKNALNGK